MTDVDEEESEEEQDPSVRTTSPAENRKASKPILLKTRPN